jgi:hypothetical protein
MSGEKNRELIMLVTSLILFITAVLILGWFFPSCGVGPSKKTIIEVEQPPENEKPKPEPEKFCDGLPVSTIKTLACPNGLVGEIVQVCRPDGKWWEASRDCKEECESEKPTWTNAIEKIAIENCVGCHGSYRDFEVFANLANSGLGGAGGASKLLYYISLPQSDDRHMPKDLPNLPLEKINQIRDWIDAGTPEKSTCEARLDHVDLFYIDRAINEFGNTIPIDIDRASYRFFVFNTAYNKGEKLEDRYKALNRTLNSLSFENEIQLCQPIDKKGVVCAIDISAIGQTTLAFKAIEFADEVNFISNTTLGKTNQLLFQTEKPFFHAENFITTTLANAELYYNIMGFENANQALQKFGVAFNRQLLQKDYKLIGTNESEISSGRNTRLIGIFEGEINGFNTQVHISFDNPALEGAEFDLFQSPFLAHSEKLFNFTASESIAGLPNGLFAFFLNVADGTLADFAPENIVHCNKGEICLDATINNAIDCMACHHDGYLPKLDVIGEHVRSSRQFNDNDIKLAKQVYLDQNVNQATFNKHNAKYLKALSKMNIKAGEKNHLIEDYIKFEKSKSLEDIAAFLFVTGDYLRSCIAGSSVLAGSIGALLNGDKITQDTLLVALPDLYKECELNINPTISVSGG